MYFELWEESLNNFICTGLDYRLLYAWCLQILSLSFIVLGGISLFMLCQDFDGNMINKEYFIPTLMLQL